MKVMNQSSPSGHLSGSVLFLVPLVKWMPSCISGRLYWMQLLSLLQKNALLNKWLELYLNNKQKNHGSFRSVKSSNMCKHTIFLLSSFFTNKRPIEHITHTNNSSCITLFRIFLKMKFFKKYCYQCVPYICARVRESRIQ